MYHIEQKKKKNCQHNTEADAIPVAVEYTAICSISDQPNKLE